jgi:hypothetical protein
MRVQAKTLPEVPLEMPAPPPRMVEVRELQEPPPNVSLPEDPGSNVPPRPRTITPVRPDPRPADARTETPEPPRAAEDAPRTPPAPTLQTTPTLQEGEAERRVRAQLAQATGDLNRINVQSLNSDARQQFDTAKRFVAQAEEALRTRNVVFAANLADKAAALAAQLSGGR